MSFLSKIIPSKSTRNALFVIVIAFSAFFAFEPLFEHLGQKAAQEFTSAIFGTIFAAVITMVLLNKQTETEEARSRSEKVFEQKINLYQNIMDQLQVLFAKADSRHTIPLGPAEITQIEFLLAKLLMIGSERSIQEFKNLYDSIISHYDSNTQTVLLTFADRQSVFRLANYCREELGLQNKRFEEDILEDIVLQGELFRKLPQLDDLNKHSIETVKDIYGCLVFDIGVPIQQIHFTDKGFVAYRSRRCDHNEICTKCNISPECVELLLTPAPNIHIKDLHIQTTNNTLQLRISDKDRGTFVVQQDRICQAIRSCFVEPA